MIILIPKKPSLSFSSKMERTTRELISLWFNSGNCIKDSDIIKDPKVEISDTDNIFVDCNSFISDFFYELKKSFEFKLKPRPASIFYFHSCSAKMIELDLEGFFRITFPHAVSLKLEKFNENFERNSGLFDESDIFDDYVFFSKSSPFHR